MSTEEAVELVTLLADAYDKQLRAGTLSIYARMIEGFDRPEAEAAILYAIANQKFFPSIAELRTAIAEGRSTAPEWEAAWDEICRCRKDHGVYVGPQWGKAFGWSDPLIDQALRIVGGYEAVCRVEYKDEPTLRAQFRDAYNNLRKRRMQADQLDALPIGQVMALAGGE